MKKVIWSSVIFVLIFFVTSGVSIAGGLKLLGIHGNSGDPGTIKVYGREMSKTSIKLLATNPNGFYEDIVIKNPYGRDVNMIDIVDVINMAHYKIGRRTYTWNKVTLLVIE